MLNWLKTHWYIPVGGIILLSPKKSIAAIARVTEGIKELANDSGFTNKKFQAEMKELGWQPGWQWCAMYAKYVWSHWLKGAKRKRAMELMGANSNVTLANFKNDKSGFFEVSKTPKVGSVVIWKSTVNSYGGHAGIVKEVFSKYFITVEGNYSNQVDIVKREYNWDYANTDLNKLVGFINVK